MRQVRTFFSGAYQTWKSARLPYRNFWRYDRNIINLPGFTDSAPLFLLGIVTYPLDLSTWRPLLLLLWHTYIPRIVRLVYFYLRRSRQALELCKLFFLLCGGGSSLMLTFGWVMSFLFPAYNFLWDGIRHSLTRFLFGVGSFISFSNHVFAAASRWTKSVLVQQTYGKVSNI